LSRSGRTETRRPAGILEARSSLKLCACCNMLQAAIRLADRLSSYWPVLISAGSLIWFRLHAIAAFPNEKNVGRNQPNHNKHPVLAFKTQKSKMLNKKLHRSAPVSCTFSILSVQDNHFGVRNILFSYLSRQDSPWSANSCRASPSSPGQVDLQPRLLPMLDTSGVAHLAGRNRHVESRRSARLPAARAHH
jgi:hypothetical protein